MLEIEFECKFSSPDERTLQQGGLRVHAACDPANSLAPPLLCTCEGLHAAVGATISAHALHDQPFAQLHLSAEMPGPPAGSA